ncbi:DinB family protein [Hymenobacter sp. BT507]|uniref:DinB family protein n=1 Tax=Hymenobacter citatus TaxID=2763506 RepID=A0ABR7MQ68_9BACT|nr:DinB family protein [Hymenobacter citatus]MBC6612702.1 DinB family protein [Hymenobacter citatus]
MPEVWLRGPLSEVPPLLQPVAHALLQAREEIQEVLAGFPASLLWQRPAGVASVGFHLQHLTGVLDRIFTYARAEALTPVQLAALAAEGHDDTNAPITPDALVAAFAQQVDSALAQLRATDETTLPEYRGVGRAGLPSTVVGLLTHAAEHTMRHVGQLSVTARVLRAAHPQER